MLDFVVEELVWATMRQREEEVRRSRRGREAKLEKEEQNSHPGGPCGRRPVFRRGTRIGSARAG